MTYTLIAGIDLLEAVRRYGLVGRTGTVRDVAGLPFVLHERSEQASAGPITFIELEGRRLLAHRGRRSPGKYRLLRGARPGLSCSPPSSVSMGNSLRRIGSSEFLTRAWM